MLDVGYVSSIKLEGNCCSIAVGGAIKTKTKQKAARQCNPFIVKLPIHITTKPWHIHKTVLFWMFGKQIKTEKVDFMESWRKHAEPQLHSQTTAKQTMKILDRNSENKAKVKARSTTGSPDQTGAK